MSVLGGGVELEHFPSLRGMVRVVKGSSYFYPSDQALSQGARLRENPLGSRGSPYTISGSAITAEILG